MTGRLPYHVNQINISPYLPGSGAARNMVRSKSLACHTDSTDSVWRSTNERLCC